MLRRDYQPGLSGALVQERFASGLAHHLNSSKATGHPLSSSAPADGLVAEHRTGGGASRAGRPPEDSLLHVRRDDVIRTQPAELTSLPSILANGQQE